MSREYPADWEARRQEVYQRDDYTCQNCGRSGGSQGNVELHAHHIVPKSKGGTHKKRNLVTVCKACHDAIHGQRPAPTPIENGDFSTRIKNAINRNYRTDKFEDRYIRLGKSTENTGPVQQEVDTGRNEKYGGCPRCGAETLTVSWVGFKPGSKAKIIECTSCSAQYNEQIEQIDGTNQRVLVKIEGPSEVESHRSAFLKELKDQLRLLR